MQEKTFWGKNKAWIIGSGIVLIFIIIYFSMSVSYNNYASRTEVAAKTKEKACQVDYDAMWKIIQQDAGVVSKYESSFKEIYTNLIEGRYSNGNSGQLMTWIQEHNPTFDASMFKTLMNTIESLRTDFATRQKELLAIEQDYNQTIVTFPGSFFLGDRKAMEVTIVTSGKTKDAYRTGEENDVDLF